MIDNFYANAFSEVYFILNNTDEKLLNKVPKKFINYLEKNMNKDYKVKIQTDIYLDKQNLLKETEAILALIYRSYWCADEEKNEFANCYENKSLKPEEIQKYKNIDEIFEKRKNINKITINQDLMVIPKENFIQKIFRKMKKAFKWS